MTKATHTGRLIIFFLFCTALSKSWAAETPQAKIECFQNKSRLMSEQSANGPLGSHWNVFEMNCEVNWSPNSNSAPSTDIIVGISGNTTKIIKESALDNRDPIKITFTLSQAELDSIPKKTTIKAPGGGTLEAYELTIYTDLKPQAGKTTRFVQKYLLSYGE